jgi:hypothetical protein
MGFIANFKAKRAAKKVHSKKVIIGNSVLI